MSPFLSPTKKSSPTENLDLTTENNKKSVKNIKSNKKSAKQKTRHARPFCVIRELGPIINGLMRQGNVWLGN